MNSGDRDRKPDRSLVVVVIGVAVVFELVRLGQWWVFAEFTAISIAVAGTWVLFFRITRCGYTSHPEPPCDQAAPGELRGCETHHKGLKTEAFFNHFGVKHPRRYLPGVTMESADAELVDAASPKKPGSLQQPAVHVLTLMLTVLGLATSVAMPAMRFLDS